MGAIESTNFTAVLNSGVLQNQTTGILPKESGKVSSFAKKEIFDVAEISETSKKNLEEDGKTKDFSTANISGNVAVVKSFILNHQENALEQQANQNCEHSLALIS